MNDNGNIRLLTPENDMRVRAFFLVAGRPFKKGGENMRQQQAVTGRGNAITTTRSWR